MHPASSKISNTTASVTKLCGLKQQPFYLSHKVVDCSIAVIFPGWTDVCWAFSGDYGQLVRRLVDLAQSNLAVGRLASVVLCSPPLASYFLTSSHIDLRV